MDFELLGAGESLAANGAHVRLLTCVNDQNNFRLASAAEPGKHSPVKSNNIKHQR
jgi:hypothetical protein